MLERLGNGLYRAVHRASGLVALFNSDGTPRNGCSNARLPIFSDIPARIALKEGRA